MNIKFKLRFFLVHVLYSFENEVILLDLTKSMIGLTAPAYEIVVEQGHIQRFAQAIGDENPLYTNEQQANDSAYGGIIAPLTFPVALTADRGDLPIELDVRRMLHGEQEFIYERMLKPGDRLTCQMKVQDVYEKQGKKEMMQFLVLDTEMRDASDALVVTSRMNIIYRPLVKG